jgi:predicted permease
VALTEREQAVRFFDQIIDSLGSLPGAEGVGAINVLPVPGGGWWLSSIWLEGESYRQGEEPVTATRVVAGQYFETMGIQLLSGRTFEPTDAASSDPVVIIDRTAAEQYWRGENPIGRPLSFARPSGDNVTWFTVVGIVDAVRHEDLDVAPTPMAYMSLAQAQFGHFRDWGMSVVIRSAGDPMALVRPARAAITAVAPDVPVYEVQLLQEMVSNNLAERRFTLIVLTVFAGIALTLAAVGIYAVLAMMVAERTREVGIRMALGADGRAVLAWVLRDGLWKTALGLGIGLVVALAGSRLMTSLVYEIAGADPVTYGAVAAVLGTVALTASIIPAWRATRIDPIQALRGE